MAFHQPLILYHGTSSHHTASILGGVDLTRGRRGDFGHGFYTTTWKEQAVRWAKIRSARDGGSPSVIAFSVTWDAMNSLNSLWFIRGHKAARDYWEFVRTCRASREAHGADVVAGPVASNWRAETAYLWYDQFSFHTDRSIAILHSMKEVRR